MSQSKKRVSCIMQARMGSSRLPGKVLKPILDRPMLYWDVYRINKCRLIDEIIIATTDLPADDAIVALCKASNWSYFRGSENDVLDRYYNAAIQFNCEVVVRITSDCPLIEPTVCDKVITEFIEAPPPGFDYINNFNEATFPIGFATEVFSFDTLARAWETDKNPAWREHVTPFIYKNPQLFKIGCVKNVINESAYRLTVDTPEDYQLVTRIYSHFSHGDFNWSDIKGLFKQQPDLLEINQNIKQKVVL